MEKYFIPRQLAEVKFLDFVNYLSSLKIPYVTANSHVAAKDLSLKVVFSGDKHNIAAKDSLLAAIVSSLMGIFVVAEDPPPS